MSARTTPYPDNPSGGSPRRRPIPRAAILLGKGFALLLLFCGLALGGGLYWLRTPAAESLILEKTAGALAAQGMTFTAARLSGPLPHRLSIEDFSLADAHGPLLKAARAEVRWSMASLLSGVILVETVELDEPELFRLPVFAPDKAEDPAPEESGSFSPPVDIRLDSLRLQGGRIHAAVLKPTAGPDGPAISLTLSGSAAIGPGGLAATLRCDARLPERGGLSLDLRLQRADSAEDSLSLNAAGGEGPGGILSLLLDKPDFPAYRLRLNGSGGMKDWRAKLALLVGRTERPAFRAGEPADAPAEPAVRPDVLDLSADLGLRCATGSLLNDLAVAPAWSARLTAGAKPGEHTPPSLSPLLGGKARVDLEFSASGTRYGLKVDAGADAWEASVSEAEIRLDAATGAQALKASFQAILKDPAAFAGDAAPAKNDAGAAKSDDNSPGNGERAGKIPSARPIPLQRASVTGALNGALGPTEASLTLNSTLEAQTQDRTFTLPCTLEAVARRQHLALRRLSANGLGIQAEAAAELHPGSGAMRAVARILAADKGEWQELVARLAGFDQLSAADSRTEDGEHHPAAFGGEVRLNASLDMPGRRPLEKTKGETTPGGETAGEKATNSARAPAVSGGAPSGSGLLRLTGSGMRWPTTRLADMLGPSLNLSARLAAGEKGENAWTVVLEEARAGIFSASGKAVFAPPVEENAPPANGPAAKKRAPTNGADGAPANGATSGPPAGKKNSATPTASGETEKASSPAAGKLEANLKADISDLAPLGQGLAGALSATVKADGPLDDLDIRLSADSPALTTPNGVFHALALRLAVHSAMTPAVPAPNRTGSPDDGGAADAGKTRPAGVPSRDGDPPLTGGLDLTGDLTLKAADSPGGPLSLAGSWRADLPADGRTINASLNNFLLQGAGVKLSASLAGQAPRTAPPPAGPMDERGPAPSGALPPLSLKGEVNVDVTDWSKVAALSGAALSGGPARARLRLDNGGGGQALSLDLTLPSLLLKDAVSGQAAFSVEGVSASLLLPRLDLSRRDSSRPGAPGILTGLAPDFRLRLGRGLAGPLQWSDGAAAIKGQAGAGEFSLSLRRGAHSPTPNARAKQGRNPARAATAGPESASVLDVRGRYDLARQEAVLAALSLSLPVRPSLNSSGRREQDAGLRLQKPVSVKFDEGMRFAGLDLAFRPGGRLSADASLVPGLMRLKANVQDLPFNFFALFTDAPLPDGKLRLTADIASSARGPRGTVTLHSDISSSRPQSAPAKNSPRAGAQRGADAPADAFALRVTANLAASPGPGAAPGSRARPLDGHIWLNGSGSFGRALPDAPREGRLAFQIPLRLSPDGVPLPNGRAPMAASIHWDGPVASLWQAAPLPDLSLSGNALLDLAVTGSLDAPKPTMTAYLGQGRYQDIAAGVLLTDIALEARLTPDGALNALLAAGDGQKGTLALEASLRGLLDKKSPLLTARGQLNDLRPLHRDDLSIGLSGLFGVRGPADAPAVTADIQVNQGEFILSSALGGSVATLEIAPGPPGAAGPGARNARTAQETDSGARRGGAQKSPAAGPSLDARIVLPRHFFIRGMGLDSEWEGELHVKGAASDPSLTGSLRPVRGQFDILSKTFAFTGGDISFTGGMRVNPLLNLELTHEGPSVTTIIRAAGSAKKPLLVLESRPPLPRDEILAQVLFGKRASDLSRFEALQLANSLRQLSADGSSLDALAGMRKTVGLDVLRVGSQDKEDQRLTSGQSGDGNLAGSRDEQEGSSSAPTLEAGKYVNDSMYVGVEQGATPDSTAVRVEVELFPSVNLQGKSSATATEMGVGWKKDY